MTIKKVFQDNNNTRLTFISEWLIILVGINLLVLMSSKYIKINFIDELIFSWIFLIICFIATLFVIKTDLKHFQSQIDFKEEEDIIELINPHGEKQKISFKEVKKIKIVVSEFRGEYGRSLRPSKGINVISIYTLTKNYHATFILSSEKEYSILKSFAKKNVKNLNMQVKGSISLSV